jgi:hypothetical protein
MTAGTGTVGRGVELRYLTDVTAAAWIGRRLHPFAKDVGSVIPEGFDDYARVFHPAYRRGSDGPVAWREIAAANGRTAHPEMQFGSIAGTWGHSSPRPDLWTETPRTGTLPRELAAALVGVLRPRTRTPDRCWFAVWEGWGGLVRPDVPKFMLPQRGYLLATGTVRDALRTFTGHEAAYQSASLWWPDDHSWFVSTEVDFTYTYVGGAQDCIDAVIAHPQIEALHARLTDGITYDSDRVNPPIPLR